MADFAYLVKGIAYGPFCAKCMQQFYEKRCFKADIWMYLNHENQLHAYTFGEMIKVFGDVKPFWLNKAEFSSIRPCSSATCEFSKLVYLPLWKHFPESEPVVLKKYGIPLMITPDKSYMFASNLPFYKVATRGKPLSAKAVNYHFRQLQMCFKLVHEPLLFQLLYDSDIVMPKKCKWCDDTDIHGLKHFVLHTMQRGHINRFVQKDPLVKEDFDFWMEMFIKAEKKSDPSLNIVEVPEEFDNFVPWKCSFLPLMGFTVMTRCCNAELLMGRLKGLKNLMKSVSASTMDNYFLPGLEMDGCKLCNVPINKPSEIIPHILSTTHTQLLLSIERAAKCDFKWYTNRVGIAKEKEKMDKELLSMNNLSIE